MENFGEKSFSYIFYIYSIICLSLAMLFGNPSFMLFSALFILLSIVYYHSGKIINNLILKNTRTLVLSKGYELSGIGVSVVRRNGLVYESISVAYLILYAPIANASTSLQSLLEKVRVPFEFSIELAELSKKKIIDDLETKMHMKEIELSNIKEADAKNFNRIKRELSIIENEIKTIKNGSKPFNVRFKIKCRYESQSMVEAINTSSKNLEYVSGLFSSILNTSYVILKGEDLLNAI
ncbi:MAG: hypothetical protein ACP5RT_01720 [Candidatus Micrarchaeia archaeon]